MLRNAMSLLWYVMLRFAMPIFYDIRYDVLCYAMLRDAMACARALNEYDML
jgi:hypothetical protein